jgi:hypothetical protein
MLSTRYSGLGICAIVVVALAVLVVAVEPQLRAYVGNSPAKEFKAMSPLPRWPQ